MTVQDLSRLLWYGAIIAHAWTAGKIVINRLSRRYPILLAYLISAVLRSAVLLYLSPTSKSYAVTWILTEPLMLLLKVGIAVEVCRRTLGAHPRIGRLASALLILVVVLSIVFSLSLARVDAPMMLSLHSLLPIVVLLKRSTVSTLAFFVLVSTLVLGFVRIPQARNIVIYRWAIIWLFCCEAATVFWLTSRGQYTAWINTVLEAVTFGCFALLASSFTARGEVAPEENMDWTAEEVDEAMGETLPELMRTKLRH